MILQRERNRLVIELFQSAEKCRYPRPLIILMRTENTGKTLLTVEWNPRELPAVIIEKSWRETYAAPCSYIRQGRIMICAVEIVDLSCPDQPVLDSLQCRRGSAAHHQGPALQIFPGDQIFSSKGIIPLCNQVNMALKEIMDMDPGNLLRLFL